jgi:hypothetical protein
MFAGFVVPGSTGDFLLTLACGTFGIVFVGFFFLRVLPHPHYTALQKSSGLTGSESNRLHRTRSEEAKHRAEQVIVEPGRPSLIVAHSRDGDALNHYDVGGEEAEGVTSNETNETSSLMSKSTSSSSGDVPEETNVKDHAHRVDIRGIKMLPLVEFWQLFSLMGILTGIGLMTIK